MLKQLLFMLPLLLALGGQVAAQDSTAGDARRAPRDAKPPMAVTPEREAAVMTFVERNHSELKELLAALKTSRPKEYERAIRDLYQTSERLANLKERDPNLFDLELKNWTLRSRIQLLAARMVMVGNDEIRSQLRDLLSEQLAVRAEILKLDRQRAQERLAKIEADIAKVDNERDAMIERQLDLLMKSAQASKTNVGGKAVRPGAKRKTTVNQPAKAKPNSNLP